jgi:hypothetical protein
MLENKEAQAVNFAASKCGNRRGVYLRDKQPIAVPS